LAPRKLTLPDPWLCRRGYIELDQGDGPERLAADPTGEYQLGDHRDPDNDDAYRIEFDTASRAIATGTPPTFGRADAINQAATIEAVRTAAATGTTVTLPAPTTS
jgi:xylose dehydrogenase (NAD/NADP)